MSSVKLVFSFCANAKFKDITCIINHHYQVFQVLRRFYSVNKSCSIVFQLHMNTLHCRDHLLTVHTQYTGKIFGSHAETTL